MIHPSNSMVYVCFPSFVHRYLCKSHIYIDACACTFSAWQGLKNALYIYRNSTFDVYLPGKKKTKRKRKRNGIVNTNPYAYILFLFLSHCNTSIILYSLLHFFLFVCFRWDDFSFLCAGTFSFRSSIIKCVCEPNKLFYA